MNTLGERIASLSLEKRALLERRLQARKSHGQPECIEPRPRPDSPAPLSFSQQRLWFLGQLEPGLTFYNLPFAFNLNGLISVGALERSLNEIVRRHEVLRTTFASREGQPVQIVHPEKLLVLSVLDLTDQDPSEREVEAARIAGLEAAAPFDLEKEAPLRAKLLKISETRHVMLVTMHHIASDGWSMGVFYRELRVLYEAFSRNLPSPLPLLSIQYADFAIWQRAQLRGAKLEKLLRYWKTQLAGAPAILELPADRPRPLIQVFQGAAYAVTIPQPAIDRLKQVARAADGTLFMALLTAFKTLLHCYTETTDIVVGTPIANRTRVELEPLIGFFVNTLVLRTDLSGDPSFLEALGRIREVTLQAYAHQELPLERLVEEIQPERSLSHNPLFQVMFVLQNTEIKTAAAPEDRTPQFRASTTKFDLTLSATETTDGLVTLFEYDTQLFDQATIAAMAENFRGVLEFAGGDPRRRISAALALEESQYRELLPSKGETTAAPAWRFMHEILEVQARRTPHRVAIEFLGQGLTYEQVDRRANRMARALRQRGLRTGDLVGLCLGRSNEMIVVLLAVLKAGCAYVPLDPNYPSERLEYMLQDSRARLVLTTAELRDRLPIQTQDVLVLDSTWNLAAEFPDEPLVLDPSPSLMCIIYTSGSTGRPKGVMVTHAGICNSAEAQRRIFPPDENCRVLQFASLNFDASLFDMTMAWGCGATLCLAPQEELRPGHPLAQLLEEQRINLITIPPSSLEVLPVAPLPELRVIFVGGESCPAALISRWASGRSIFNAYGPTETSIWCTVAKCEDNGINPTIGRPILNTRVYMLDRTLQPVSVGVPGELYVAGAGVSYGYLDRNELTAERFLPDPFYNEPGARMYKTGDRARLLADGQIQYLGRIDRQLKLRGYRIEPEEIEHEMLQHPGVDAAAVNVVSAASGNRFLTGYFVETAGVRVNPVELQETLRRRLPEYMVPGGFMRLDALPLNGSGKLDYQALSRLPVRTSGDDAPWMAPTNATEEQIADIWKSILELERVGIHQRFFDLGGHSLLATRVASRVSEAFAIDLPLRAIFEHSTVAELARAVEELKKSIPPETDEIKLVPLSRNLVTVPETGSA